MAQDLRFSQPPGDGESSRRSVRPLERRSERRPVQRSPRRSTRRGHEAGGSSPAPASWWRRGWSGALAAGVLLATAPFVPVSSASGAHEAGSAQPACSSPDARGACPSDAPAAGPRAVHATKPLSANANANASTGIAPQRTLRAARAGGQPLDCSGATIYAIQRGATATSAGALLALTASTLGSASVTATVDSTIPGAGFANALGVSKGGTAAYVVDQVPANDGSVNVYGFNASTDAWTTYTGTAGSGDDFVAGAVDPANGIYYYGSYSSGTASSPGVATVYGFNTVTNTAIPGIIATFNLPISSASGSNGDFTFDAAGNLFALESAGAAAAIGRVNGPLPTTGSSTGVGLTDTKLSTIPDPSSDQYNGAAFDNAGNLYIEFTGNGMTFLEQMNPNTGVVTAGPTPYSNNDAFSVDLGACSTNPTLTLKKNIVGRFQSSVTANDQFGLSITGGGVSMGNTATTTGTALGVQSAAAGPIIAMSNDTYTLAETAASGGSLANYTTTYSCIDTANGNNPIGAGVGTSFSLPFPASVAGQKSPNVLCTFTNTPVAAAPSLTIMKTVLPTSVMNAGQPVVYSFVVKNTGNVTLTNITVAETAFSGSNGAPTASCPAGAASLAPGASVTCTATYNVSQTDVNLGIVTNTAKATGTPPTGSPVTSPPSSAVVTSTPTPSISIMKSVLPTSVTTLGQPVVYSFVVTNTGNVTLTAISVTDTAFSGTGPKPVIMCPGGAPSLAPNVSVTCTATYDVTQADINAGKVTNTATATGTPPTGLPVTSLPSSALVTANQMPALTIVKSVLPTTVTAANQPVAYSFLVKNTGNVTLTSVTVTDTAFSGTGTPLGISCPVGAASLAPGVSVTCTATYNVTQADINAGTVNNTATATGTTPTNAPVTSLPSSAVVTATQMPALTILKSVLPTTVATANQQVAYSFLVMNTGNVTLTAVSVTDMAFTGTGTPLSISCPAGAASLAPGVSVTCTATYNVTQHDIDAGQVTNTATATGTPPSGTPVTSLPSSAKVTANQTPSLSILKAVTESSLTSPGEILHYTFLVTNTGDVTLTNVAVNETVFSGSGTPPVIMCPAAAASMAPDASVTCTATYSVTQSDLNAGNVANTATATGTPPSDTPVTSPPSSANVPNNTPPSLTIVKSVVPMTVTAAGQPVVYSFLVMNTGNVTLTNITVAENAFTGSGTAPVITCPAGAASLAPGASVTCTASYNVTQADINAGKVNNTATATGTPPSGSPVTSPPSSAMVTATQTPALTIVKSVVPTTVTAPGQSVSYSFLVTNTGNVTLTNVTVAESVFSGSGTAPVVGCPAGAASLAPGVSVTCTASYNVTQADINAGKVNNTATATGTPPSGSPVTSPPSSAMVTATQTPALTIAKKASPTTVTAVGQTVTYSFVVTNTGNVTLTNVTVTETVFSGTGAAPVVACPAGAASLAPGASVTCTATYVVTSADINSGKLKNTATATGTPPSGPPTVSPPSSATVTATPPITPPVTPPAAVNGGHPGPVGHGDLGIELLGGAVALSAIGALAVRRRVRRRY